MEGKAGVSPSGGRKRGRGSWVFFKEGRGRRKRDSCSFSIRDEGRGGGETRVSSTGLRGAGDEKPWFLRRW